MSRPGFIEITALVPEWSLAYPQIVTLLVEQWERSAARRRDAVRLAGPPLLTVEDYHAPADWGATDRKLVVVQGPAELLGGEGEELSSWPVQAAQSA